MPSRSICIGIFLGFLSTTAPVCLIAQQSSPSTKTSPGQLSPPASAAIRGTVVDINGGVIPMASVTLESMASAAVKRTVNADANGHFDFSGVAPGTYRVTITAPGFATSVQTDIPVEAGKDLELARLTLPLAATSTDVQVLYTEHEIAEQQLEIEEKQRVFAVFPNFYSSYIWNAAPLSAGQKMRLALKSALDPTAFLGAGFAAGVEQARNDFAGYGQGTQGYAKRYGAAFMDGFDGSIVGDGVFPALFHQDPRYFYKADGTAKQKALYAISTVVIRRSDRGKWQPNYSGILGNLASGSLSNLYYPTHDRGAGLTFQNAAIGTAFGAVGALLRQFVVPRLTSGGPPKTP